MEENYKKLYEAMCESCEDLVKRVKELEQFNAILQAEKKQWELEKIFQQNIIQQALNRSNSTNNEYLEENKRLKEEIKRIRDGNID